MFSDPDDYRVPIKWLLYNVMNTINKLLIFLDLSAI